MGLFLKVYGCKDFVFRLTHQSLVSIVDLSLLAVGIIMLQLFYRLLQKKLTAGPARSTVNSRES